MHHEHHHEEQEFSFKSLFLPLTTIKAIHWIIIIGLIAFCNSLFNGFIWDDEGFIIKNVYVQQFNIEKIVTSNIDAGQGFTSNYYRPFTSFTFAIDSLIWKQNAFGFHLTNLLFHILAGVMLFLFLSKLGVRKIFSFIISLVFLIHPVQTEAVTYISSRGDSMYAFFLFTALVCFLQGVRKQSFLYFFFCFLFFGVSIFSKETSIAAVFLFPLLLFMESLSSKLSFVSFLKKQKKATFTLVSIGAVVLGYLVLRLTVLNFANTLNFFTSLSNLSPIQQLYATHIEVRLFTFAKVIWEYMGVLVFPYHLHMYRNIDYVTSFFSIWVFASILLGLFIVILSIYELRKKHKAYILFGFLLSSFTLLPVSGVVPINWVLFEHWLYVPIVGFCIVVFRTFQIFIPQLLLNKRSKTILTFGGVILFGIYMVLTIYQNSLWSDPIKLYTYTLQFTETAPIDNNLGMSYGEEGKSEAAIYYYQRSLNIQPYPQTYYNLGIEYKLQGKYSLAEKAFKDALTLKPDFSQAKDNLVVIYLRTGQYDKAIQLSNNSPQIEEIIKKLKTQKNNTN